MKHKILRHQQELKDWTSGRMVYPITWEIDPTNKCNNYCPKCVGGRFNKSVSLPYEILLSCINQIKDMGSKGIIFTGGGEPLMNKFLPSVIEETVDISMGICTNGGLLTPDVSEILLNKCEWIRFSVDASDSEMYLAVHGVDEYMHVISNIETVVEMKNAIGSSCIVGIAFLTGEETVDGMWGATVVAKSLGVDYIRFRPFINDTTNVDIQLEECKKLETDKFKVHVNQYKYDVITGRVQRDYGTCQGQNFIGVIAADGQVYPCCYKRGITKYAFGNVYTQTLKSIWSGDRHKKIIKSLDLKDCPTTCRYATMNETLESMHEDIVGENFL